MSRISQYPLDTNIEGNDKWIGTSVNNANATKNFSVDNVIQYINSSGGVDSQNLRYTYQNVQGDDVRLASTISFTPSLGDNVPFAGITEWTISAFSKEVKDVRTYYNAPLVGSTILITNAFNPSNWAIFRWDSVTVDILDPDFYTIALTHIDSTGELVVGQDYLIALLDSVAGGSATWGSIIGTLSSQTDLQTALNAKQATLVSGTNIQSINSSSILTSGNINLQVPLVSGTNIKTINSTTLLGSGDVAVQPTLVSGTNIKTINSTSLLGSGDIVIATLPSGVAGAIQFSNGSAFASDATNFFWNDTNNRLGIGINTLRTSLDIYNYAIPPIITVSSQKAFDVAGTLIGGIQAIQHTTLTAPSGAMYFKSETGNAAQGKITFETGSALGSISEKMVIGFNGNVGIGETTPTAKLQVKGSGSTSATTSLLIQNSSGNNSITTTDDGSTIIYSNLASSIAPLIVNNQSGWSGSYTQRVQTWRSAGVDKCWINGAGGMVIGDTCQALTYTSTQGSSVNDVAYRGTYTGAGNGLYFPTTNATAIATVGIERMRINASGYVGIGTNAPTTNLQVTQGTAGVGTVATNGTITLTGTSTTFINTFKVGDTITVSGETVRTIATIVSNTSLTVTVAFSTTASALTYTLVGGDRLSVLGNGNVGIGTTTPSQKLELIGNAVFRSTQRIDINTAQAAVVGVLAGSSIGTYGNFSLISSSGLIGESMDISYWNGTTYYPSFRVANVASGFSNLQLMKDGGNVGINTSTPTAKLQVQGSGATSATTSLLVQNSAGNEALRIYDDRLVVIGSIIQSDSIAIGQSNPNLKGIGQSGSRILINYVNGGGVKFSNSSTGFPTLIVGEVSENMVSFGGITSLFPALKRASNNLELKNADDTFGAGLSVGASLNASAILQADSTTKGALLPRMTTTQRNAIATPATGLIVYDTTLLSFYQYNGTAWTAVGGGGGTPSGVAGAVQFSNGSAFSSDATNFFWDDTNNRLGIGTATPSGRLHIKGISALDTDLALRVESDVARMLLQVDNSGTTRISGATARFLVGVETGGLGGYRLVIAGSSHFSPSGTGNAGAFQIDQGAPSSSSRTLYYDGAGALKNVIQASGDSYVTSGNLGIGITTPTARLHTKGSGATSATFSFRAENSTNTRSIIFTDEGKLSFNSSATSKMNIDSGTTTISFSNASSDALTGGAVGIQYATGLANANGILYCIGPNESHSFRKVIQLDGGISANSYYTMSLVDGGATYSNTYKMIEVIPTLVLTGAGAKNVVGYSFKPTITASANTKLFGAVFENGGLLIGGAATSANASASLEVISTTQGLLPPRMTNAQVLAIVTPANGLMVYNTTIDHLCVYQAGAWVKINHSPM